MEFELFLYPLNKDSINMFDNQIFLILYLRQILGLLLPKA